LRTQLSSTRRSDGLTANGLAPLDISRASMAPLEL
jgi:hypothetical protein